MNNTTKTDNWTFIKQHAVIERAPDALTGIILLCCIWIVVVNMLVFLLLLFNRKSLKDFVTLQLLCLSMTDFLVGATAIPVTMTYYITSAFPSAKTCAGIMFGYIVAQLASLFHVFSICLHRFVTIKYQRHSSHNSGERMVKRILYHFLAVWISATILVGIPFFRYVKFAQNLEECSSRGKLFEEFYCNECMFPRPKTWC